MGAGPGRPWPGVCLDANSLFSGIASPNSASARILRNIDAGVFCFVYAQPIVDEYFRKIDEDGGIARLFERRGVPVDEVRCVVAELLAVGTAIDLLGDAPHFPDDPDDAMYLHCAEQAPAAYIVTFDGALLGLRTWSITQIVRPGALLDLHVAYGGQLVD